MNTTALTPTSAHSPNALIITSGSSQEGSSNGITQPGYRLHDGIGPLRRRRTLAACLRPTTDAAGVVRSLLGRCCPQLSSR